LLDLTPERLAIGITTYVVLLFSLSVHESAHGWMAWKMGDNTARSEGRISLNPLVHIDPIGTFLIPVLQIFWGGVPLLGWAKPTPYDPRNFDRQRTMAQGHVMVAGAGPVSNLVLALLFTGGLFFMVRVQLTQGFSDPMLMIVATGIQMNVALALFNLVPLPPLDGSKVASWGLPRSFGERYDRLMEPYGHWILLILFMTGVLSWLINPLMRSLIRTLYGLALP
jgi:Zn-dependent protease